MSKPAQYYQGVNNVLLPHVPPEALSVLDVGCGAGMLGKALREEDPLREVIGLEVNLEAAALAREHLSAVHVLDVEREDPPIEDGSIDCIVYGDVLEHLRDPLGVLERHRRLLSSYGTVLCSVPNTQHHSVLRELLRGDWQYQSQGLLDSTHIRCFTAASFIKLLLDAGYLPRLVDQSTIGLHTEGFVDALAPMLHYLGVDGRRAQYALTAYQYVFAGTRLLVPPPQESPPLSFVVCVNDDQLLASNLLASPCMQSGKHELIAMRGCQSAAEGLNAGVARATHETVVCVHQDVYLPKGWDGWLAWALARAGDFGVLGLLGVSASNELQGLVIDRQRATYSLACKEPSLVQTLDELLLVVRKGSPMRFDPALGWHLYGSDICLEARKYGLRSFAINAPALHNSLLGDVLPTIFSASANYMARKWEDSLPIHTSCIDIE